MNAPRYPHQRVQSIESLRHPLGMGPSELLALAKRASHLYRIAKTVPKDDGTVRVLYDTREPLKAVLGRINEHFLRRVIYPDYLTGGVPRKDYTDSVKIHVGAKSVIKEDISKFYPSVSFDVVREIWSGFFGFADEVSDLLTMLTTRDGHLEQGAPTSGYLANLALWDIESQLIAQIASAGATRYSRHVDDITISSPEHLSASRVDWIVRMVAGALASKGLRVNASKHEVMQAGGQIKILKLVGNAKPSLPPKERSRVRALVHTFCLRVESGESPEELELLLPRVRGQAHKVKRFHRRAGERLVEQVNQAAQLLKNQTTDAPPVNQPSPNLVFGEAIASQQSPESDPPW
ncbi:reverse transcriptase family protein [Ralstonia chuxiongensis]|uniref:reverse transcriptase family protein n=1 Tax=Ralstonia chuxiongensis TaxID=2957504 RepID=UPI00292F3045|nr:reverse transcriptase family protein [Ralstonia chuxiongensis]